MRVWLCQAKLAVEVTRDLDPSDSGFGRGRRSYFCQYFRPFFGDRDSVFHVRAGLAIHGDYRPAVLEHFRLMRPQIDHWLDGKHITCFYLWSLPRLSIIRNLRILVHATTDSMTYIVAHHSIAVAFGVLLHGGANIT